MMVTMKTTTKTAVTTNLMPKKCSMTSLRSSERNTCAQAGKGFVDQRLLDDWALSLHLEQRKMLAVTLMENFKTRQKMNIKEAATEARSIVGFNE